MSEWIFKIIYYPILVIITMCCSVVLAVIFKDVGWDYPFRWICLIGLLALIADWVVNK